jgi:hypothetical protein
VKTPVDHVRYNRGQEKGVARFPLAEEELAATKLVLNIAKIGLTEDQFSNFVAITAICSWN